MPIDVIVILMDTAVVISANVVHVNNYRYAIPNEDVLIEVLQRGIVKAILI